MSTVRERVEKGAALLDEHAPGWDNVIDLDRLSLVSCENCVCGQLAMAAAAKYLKLSRFRFNSNNPFWAMTRWLGRRRGLRHSINAWEFGFDTNGNVTYGRLDREWKRLIRARLKAKAAS